MANVDDILFSSFILRRVTCVLVLIVFGHSQNVAGKTLVQTHIFGFTFRQVTLRLMLMLMLQNWIARRCVSLYTKWIWKK